MEARHRRRDAFAADFSRRKGDAAAGKVHNNTGEREESNEAGQRRLCCDYPSVTTASI